MPGALSYLIEKVEGLEKTAQSLLSRQEESYLPHWMDVDELMMFFFGFMLGRYERFYCRFDTQIFMGSIPLYLKKRNEAIDHAIKNGFV